MSFDTPVLLLFFNRPDLAAKVFARVREVRPSRLFLAVDGPREDRAGEADLVKQNEAFAAAVDWPCEVSTLSRESNLGCGPAVSKAITWFFSEVESGIILEDDCVPARSFFPFAAELLERYKDDDRVMMINGTSYLPETIETRHSYYFSRFGNIWGWASWRRAWNCYDYELSRWPHDETAQNRLREFGALPRWHINRNFALSKKGIINTWDYQWEHAILAHDGMVVAPVKNLVSNVGFDERATHTFNGDDGRAGLSYAAVEFPLSHPPKVEVDEGLDGDYRKRFLMSPAMLAKAILRKIGKRLGWSRLSRKTVYEAK